MTDTLIERSARLTRFRGHRAELALALRVTVSALVSFAVSNILHVPLPLWTVLTAVILTQATFGSSLKATIDYMVGTVCGAVYAGAIAVVIPHESEIAKTGVLALAVAPLALLGGLKPSFGTATFTGVLVLMVPEIAPVSALESVVFRVVEVAVGALTALIVSMLVLPTRAQILVIEAAARMLKLMAQTLPELAAALSEAGDAESLRGLQDRIGDAFSRLEVLAAQASHERIGLVATAPDPGPLLRTVLRLRHDLVILGRAAAAPLPEAVQKRFGPGLNHVARMVADGLRAVADALVAGREPPPLDRVDRGLEAFTETFAAVREEHLTLSLPLDAVERMFALGFALDQLRGHLRDLERCVREAAHKR
jgi:uncharacterized membrane protein YccC